MSRMASNLALARLVSNETIPAWAKQSKGEYDMSALQSEFLMNFEATLKPALTVGDGALGLRAIADVTGGTFPAPPSSSAP